MLDDLLAGGLPEELGRLVAERSEGNPLFVEEIVRKLIDDGVLRASDGVGLGGRDAREPRGPAAVDPGPDRGAAGRPARRREGAPAGRGRRRPGVLVGRGRRAERRGAGGRARRARPAPREGARAAQRPAELLGRARVHVPARADPRQRLRLAAEVAARVEARPGRAVGRGEGRRPRGRDRGADRDPRPGGPPLLRRARRRLGPARGRAARRLPMGDGGGRPCRRAVAARSRRAAGTGEALGLAEAIGLPAAERAPIARELYDASFGTLTVERVDDGGADGARAVRGGGRRAPGRRRGVVADHPDVPAGPPGGGARARPPGDRAARAVR